MPRRKANRTPEEELQYQESKKQKRIETQRRYREKKRIEKALFSSNANTDTSNAVTNELELIETSQNDDSSPLIMNHTTFQNDVFDPQNENNIASQNDASVPLINDVESQNDVFDAQDMIDAEFQSNTPIPQKIYVKSNIKHQNINDIIEQTIGEMDLSCKNCSALHFRNEIVTKEGDLFSDCCGKGKIHLDPMPDPPDYLRSLFDRSNQNSNEFYENIRCYNNAFAFASFNANLVRFNGRPGPFCFKISGQIYYQINTSLYPAHDETPAFGQLFIIDPNEALQHRSNVFDYLNADILESLDYTMREHNVFCQSYVMMADELKNQMQANDGTPCELQLLFSLKPGMDQRRYNYQRVNEVAAIFSTTADGEIPESYVTVRNKSTKSLQTLSSMDPNVEPWIYPLFYPYGTQGWHRNIMQINSNRRVTRREYTKYRLAIRPNEFNTFLLGRRLFQQWVVDFYVKMEKDRLEYHKNHQKELRVDTYKNLNDHLNANAENTNSTIGKITILPSSFTGSPRNMLQHYHDAMAIVREFGKPDIFLTMTCNPNWKEIKDNFFTGQQPCDRPDLVARVFNIKKDQLIDLIVKKHFFGKVAAFVYVIEFQKRGLPHVHLLVTLDKDSKIMSSEAIDEVISAEIPDPQTHPILHETVMRNMVHGPCGDWCMVNGKCSKHYPKTFQDKTTINDNGYPTYQRKNNGKTYEKRGGFVVDNRNVVPYSPKLIKLFNCHMNVEVVSSIQSVKYIYKYIYKGHDAASVVVQSSTGDSVVNHDEIKQYIDTRYVSPIEACWRIFSMKLQKKSHAIYRLPVHLPNEHNVILDTTNDSEKLSEALAQMTMLLEYFKLNARCESAREYLYSEIPKHFVFITKIVNKKKSQYWRPRQNSKCIGRMYSVSPAQSELFHLRILLLSVKGATSFDDLKTVNGVLQPTFAAACLALGLVENDDEWKKAMTEAVSWMMPRQLRYLFVRILIHCQPKYPHDLWEEFRFSMSEDYARNYDALQSQKMAYDDILKLLHDQGYEEFHVDDMDAIESITQNIIEMPSEQHSEIGQRQYAKMNDKQKEIVNMILNSVENSNNNGCFFIDGPGGTGKTFIYNTLYHLLKGQNKAVSAMAFTGIAATLLPEGKTVHKTLGLPVPLFADSSSSIKKQTEPGRKLKNTDVFIWDEAPMAPKYALDIMHRKLKDVMENDFLFGGKIVVLGGDFRQLLPIKENATRNEVIDLSIKFSRLWRHFHKFQLTENMRVLPEELEFANFVLKVGNGELNDNDDEIEIPSRLLAEPGSDIVDEIYGNVLRNREYEKASTKAILSARNIDVDEINKRVVKLLDPSTERTYNSIDSIDISDDNGEIGTTILPEYLNTLCPPSLPPHTLLLRKNAVIMLIRNLNIDEGLCNGTRLLIIDFSDHLLKCKILTGDKAGTLTIISRMSIQCENVYPFNFKRRQFPVKLAFAMTINKSQGQTFEQIGIDLRRGVFNHGQFYVAVSRVRSWHSLKIFLDSNNNSKSSTKNYVYKELFT